MPTLLLLPAAIVNGSVRPGAVKTPPVKFAAVTLTDPVPVLVNVTDRLEVLPLSTLPKARLFEETLNDCEPVTVIVAEAVLVVSATLFAVTVYVPVVLGAVNSPELETDPPVADHVTDVLDEPATEAVNCCVPPVTRVAEVGVIETDTDVAALTVTVAEADLLVSAALVAFTVYVPAVLGAVYRPELDTVPPVADQVTEVFVEPVTEAVNCCVAPAISEVDVGLMETATGAATVIVAFADFVVSATLVAVTV